MFSCIPYGTFRKIVPVLLLLHVLKTGDHLRSVPFYYNSPFCFFCRLRLNGTVSPPFILVTCNTYGRRQKKFPFTIRTRLISVQLPFLSVFKPFPFCPKGSPSVLVNGPDGVIKHAQSLIAQEGTRQFSDRDRARARAT